MKLLHTGTDPVPVPVYLFRDIFEYGRYPISDAFLRVSGSHFYVIRMNSRRIHNG